MEKRTHFPFFFLLFFCSTVLSTVDAAVKSWDEHRHHQSVSKLFVFGDSYVDTGNLGKFVPSWKEPYGINFPGKPSGRFSDGRVLTDYIASYYGVESPVPFEMRNVTGESKLQYGMNFAYGGAGVFNTIVEFASNMTIQIDNFQKLIEENVYTKNDLNNSVVLVSVGGNDYTTFLFRNGSFQDMPAFTKELVEALAIDLKRIKGLGVKNVLVTGVEPTGCMPSLTAENSYQKCLENYNSAAQFHNQILQQRVQMLNNESHSSVFITLDLYSAFMSALNGQANHSGNSELGSSLRPCCLGVSDKYSCGSVDEKGEKKYEVCKNPELSFFWDNYHPAQNGWHAIFSALKLSSLH